MGTEKLFLSIIQRGLFMKSTLLASIVLGIVLAQPVKQTVVAGAHKICQFAMKSSVQCEKVC